MRRYFIIINIFLITGFFNILLSQKLHIAPFEGIVYKLPNGKKYYKFNENYKEFPVINTIQWDKINVPSRDVEDGFPDVERRGAFAIMFNTTFRATETAMYAFSLTSDDGTILWIDGEEIINNDTEGAMHMKTDTVAITEGMHEMQIWYIQAFPTKYGVIFDHEHVDIPLEYPKEDISFNSDILFEINAFDLSEEGLSLLDNLVNKLSRRPGMMVRIIGHTDNTGSPSYNLKLSEKRANSLKHYLSSKLKGKKISFATSGRGDAMPIADNSTEEGRSKNRRVSIELVYK